VGNAAEWGGAGGGQDFAPDGAFGWSATFRSLQRADSRMERERLGVRRQSEAATALSGGRWRDVLRKISVRAKAVSRCACHRSPKSNKVSSSVWWPCASTESRPDGAGEWGGAGGDKDFAPDGAAKTSALFELLEERVINFKYFFAAKAELF